MSTGLFSRYCEVGTSFQFCYFEKIVPLCASSGERRTSKNNGAHFLYSTKIILLGGIDRNTLPLMAGLTAITTLAEIAARSFSGILDFHTWEGVHAKLLQHALGNTIDGDPLNIHLGLLRAVVITLLAFLLLKLQGDAANGPLIDVPRH